MCVLVVAEARMARLVEEGQTNHAEVNDLDLETAVLPGDTSEPFGNGSPDPSGSGASDDDEKDRSS